MIINMTGGGGGAALNFDVVRYATESELLAATPKENTIGIISTTEMTGWIIDANQPENMTNGMVWISTGASSTVEFNALKKNAVQVYPISAKQYVSGALVGRDIMVYQDGNFVDLIKYLYNKGDRCEENTGGWTFNSARDHEDRTGSYIDNGDSITLKSSGEYVSIQAVTNKKINLSDFSRIRVNITDYSATEHGYLWFKYGNVQAMGDGIGRLTITDVGEWEIDISTESGEYYIGLEAYSNMSGASIRATFDIIWLKG